MVAGMLNEKLALVTVTSESFMPGTMVMLHSFLKHNSWFAEANGDIVIIHESLPPQLQRLTGCFKNITWFQVGEELKVKVDALYRGIPRLKLGKKKNRFYSLELFRLSGYRKVLFCDSDILFLGSIIELFNSPGETGRLLGGGDLYYFTGKAIEADTFMPLEDETDPGVNREMIKNTFNVGFLIIDEQILSQRHYYNMMNLLNIDLWRKIKAPRTDQVIFNLYFKECCRLLSARYNYLVSHADVIPLKENIPINEIKVLHFNGKAKPWECLNVIQSVSTDPLLIRFIKLWQREFLDFLPQYHLRSCFINRKVKE
jgi:lipopolysaccharide biosynthesis glycosyltransferase